MTSIRGRTALAITCLERALAVNQILGEPSLSPIVEALWGYVEREQYLWTDWLEQQPDLRPFRRSARGAREARERQGIGRLPPAPPARRLTRFTTHLQPLSRLALVSPTPYRNR